MFCGDTYEWRQRFCLGGLLPAQLRYHNGRLEEGMLEFGWS